MRCTKGGLYSCAHCNNIKSDERALQRMEWTGGQVKSRKTGEEDLVKQRCTQAETRSVEEPTRQAPEKRRCAANASTPPQTGNRLLRRLSIKRFHIAG